MKSMKGKVLKKLKSIKPIVYLKQAERLLLHVNVNLNAASSDHAFFHNFTSNPTQQPEDIIDLDDMLMTDLLEEDDVELNDEEDDKENIVPPPPLNTVKKPYLSESSFWRPDSSSSNKLGLLKNTKEDPDLENENSDNPTIQQMETSSSEKVPLSEIDVSSFRRPELSSGSLFDPNLLAAFQQALMENNKIRELAERKFRIEKPPPKVPKTDEKISSSNLLLTFEEKCPPGGNESVILYTTSLRGIRKTFEDCHSIRFLLESFRVLFHERDVSMHSDFREELWKILGKAKGPAAVMVPPRLFIRGRYIGGAEEVLVLHERGEFRRLFDGIPVDDRSNGPCRGCAGIRFVVCFNCSGSHRVIADDYDGSWVNCLECNENGLKICPICCLN